MANTLSISLLETGVDKLAVEYGKVIENLQHMTIADKIKNKDLSGDPQGGTINVKRFTNIIGQPYGTARSGRAGQTVKVDPVLVEINDNTEYIEEVEEADLMMYGVDGLIQRRTKNHGEALAVELDSKLLAEAVEKGEKLTLQGSTTKDKVEEAIVGLEELRNEYVEGVPRTKIVVVASPTVYGALRDSINSVPNSLGLGAMANFEEGIFANTRIFSSVFLPKGINFVVMAEGSLAQPVRTSIYNPKKVDLSDATAFGLFAYKGTKAVSPDLIMYDGTKVSA